MWRKINFNMQNIELITEKAVLIKMPNKSAYKGMTFWHPAKLIREEGHKGYLMSLSYTDEFEFRLYKKREHKKTISAKEMEEAFNNPQLNDETYLEVTEPTPITDAVTVNEELMR